MRKIDWGKVFRILETAGTSLITDPPDPVFSYKGTIYVRPAGRGTVMVQEPYRERYLDDEVLPDGYYDATIIIRPPRPPKHCEHPDFHHSIDDHTRECWRRG